MACIQPTQPSQPSQPSQPANVASNIPSHELTWQFVVNKYFIDTTTGVADTDAQTTLKSALLHIKNTLKGFSSSPWTVISSCDGVTASVGTDLWDTVGDLVNNLSGSAHSWIVLQQAGIAAKFQVCIDLNGNLSHMRSLSIVVSPASGFGVANGGADGTTTDRPTALDEYVSINNASWWTGASVLQRHTLHIMQSTDGSDTRVLGFGNASGAIRSNNTLLWHFFKPIDPPSVWNRPACWTVMRAASADQLSYTVITNDSSTRFIHDGVGSGIQRYATLGFGAIVFNDLVQSTTHSNSVSGDYTFTPLVMMSDTVGLEGFYGRPADFYGAPAHLVNFSSPVRHATNNSRSWIQIGHYLLPWPAGATLKRL